MKKNQNNNFTLVEIALALGVITIGIVAVVALFPVGSDASRNAIAQTHAAESADQFIQLMENRVRSNWTSSISNIPTDKGTSDGDDSVNLPDGEGVFGNGTIHELDVADGLYQVVSFVDAGTEDGELDEDDIVDFHGVLSIWQEEITEIPDDEIAIRLMVEVSWPASVPYDNREKEVYSRELFNR